MNQANGREIGCVGSGRRDGKQGIVGKRVGLHARPVAVAVADIEIGALVEIADRPDRIADADVDAGMRLEKPGEAGRKPEDGERRIGADRQPVSGLGTEQRLRSVGNPVEQRVQHSVVGIARIGQLETACQTNEKRLADGLLERLDMLADSGLGQPQLVAGGGETEVTGGGFERAEPSQRRHLSGHGQGTYKLNRPMSAKTLICLRSKGARQSVIVSAGAP